MPGGRVPAMKKLKRARKKVKTYTPNRFETSLLDFKKEKEEGKDEK